MTSIKTQDFTRSLVFFQLYFPTHYWIGQGVRALLFGALFCRIIDATAVTIPGLDPSREQAWAEQVRQYLRVGEVVTLSTPTGKFIALHAQARDRGPNHGGVILLPSPDTYPDSDPIGSLRVALSERGWHTLAIQLPTLVVGSGSVDYAPVVPAACARLHEGIVWFGTQHIANLVVLGHGLGAAIAAACVAENTDKDSVGGVILLGVGGAEALPPVLDPVAAVLKIALPILDLFGEEDAPLVRTGARAREAGRRDRGQRYEQVMLPGVDHSLAGAKDIVVARIIGWLNRAVPGVEIKRTR